MSAPAKFEASIEPERNCARVRFAGAFNAGEMQAAAARVESLLPKLKPGFSVLADFSRVDAMDLDCVPHLTRIMDLCREHGIGLIVRVLPEPTKDIGIKLLAIVHYRGKVKTVTAETLEEAERALG